ncbi:MAG: putative intron-binding protein aquarius [Streblomastix strix]|uniref:Putative intron-binding protein aquarius n=1 Tax=Streblomastix strix TaxID=222440 RepID=A0A5J4VXJ6_9EUKA|nr:MAG: putative intron-binding protein aquarius [Streblomastix strix]
MIEKECSFNPLYGRPSRLTTIDRYQGSQNDYVLVSLTRTARLGHLKDVRRLTVAVSRARLGLYVFGSGKLFLPQNLNEDKKIVEEEKQKDSEADTILPMMVRLTDNMNRPTRLVIGLNERYNSQSQTPTQRAVGQQLLSAKQISTADEMSNISRALEAAATAVAFGQR